MTASDRYTKAMDVAQQIGEKCFTHRFPDGSDQVDLMVWMADKIREHVDWCIEQTREECAVIAETHPSVPSFQNGKLITTAQQRAEIASAIRNHPVIAKEMEPMSHLRGIVGVCLLWALVFVSPVNAGGHVNGFVNSDGYTFNSGYWYYGASPQAYYRTLISTPGYYSYGYYYPGSSYYQYTAYYPPKAAVSYTDPDWRTKLLDIAQQRDKTEGKVRLGAFEQQYFLESVRALGLEGNFTWRGYGAVPPYPVIGAAHYAQSYGANATTQYGYSYSTIAQLYGDNTNLNSLYQQAAQLTRQLLQLGGEANAGFQALVNTEGGNRARVAEIIVKGQMAMQILNALNAPSTVETRGFSFKVEPNGNVQRQEQNVSPETKNELMRLWKINADARCAECHSGKTVKGGFNLADYPRYDPAQKQAVWLRLTTTDPDKVMPRLKDGTPGRRLTPEELKLWVLN